MTSFLRRAFLALFLFLPFMAPAQADSFTAKQEAEIERIIHDYLVNNPEVLVKAFEELERRSEDDRVSQARNAVKEHSKALYNDAEDFVAGNPKGDVTLVEFFDYRCVYCKRSFQPLMDFIEKDGNIRLVLKEFPILGPASMEASKAAMAAQKQGRYMDMHKGLYTHKGELDSDAINAIAKKAGVDVAKMREDMKDPALADRVSRAYRIAEAIGIDGTPAFIAGGALHPGMVDEERLTEIVSALRGG